MRQEGHRDYLRPNDLATALRLLSERPLIIVAGATDAYPAGLLRPSAGAILDISGLRELAGITPTEKHHRIGALTTWTEIADADLPPWFDGLRQAAREVGGRQVQNAGTLAGNLCHASPAADGLPNLLVLDAVVELASSAGIRRIAVAEFVTGNRRTVRRADELVTAILVPKPAAPAGIGLPAAPAGVGLPAAPVRAGFVKLGARRFLVISIVSVAVLLEPTVDGRVGRLRVAVGACSEVPRRLLALERDLEGLALDGLGRQVRPDHLAALSPIDDVRATAAYRREAALVLLRRLLDSGLRADWPEDAAGGVGESAAPDGEAGGTAPPWLLVNGTRMAVSAPPDTRLSDVLRDRLGLTGTKVGCNAGDCGACTVRLDGKAVCACLTPVGQALGRRVETVEGLADESRRLSRLQAAFLRLNAVQCGICTPGMLMAAGDLLRRAARPSRTQVEQALGGVLCRCTGYRSIVDAVLLAAGDEPIDRGQPAGGPAIGKAVGADVVRTDGAAKVTGQARFGADDSPADGLQLRVVRSPHAHARFTLGDLDALQDRWPGLARVLTAADIPVNRFGIYPDLRDQPVLAEGMVRQRGEAVLALIGDADTLERVTDDQIPIAWQPLPALTDVESALAAGAPALHPGCPDNVLVRGRVVCGDVDAAFADAAVVAEGQFETSFVEHAYIEPEAGYARRVGDRIAIVATTQSPFMDRDEVAHILNVPRHRIRVIPSVCGGGFGGKLDLSVQPLVAVAAWLLGRPVRCVYTRPESMASTTKRHPARLSVRAAATADGRLLAVDFQGDYDTGAYASWGPTVANRVPVHAGGPYAVANCRALTRAVYTHGPSGGAFRGFGVPQSAIATESLMDQLAVKLALDPLDFRLKNALRPGSVTVTGQVLGSSCGLVACLESLRPRWRQWREAAEVFNRQASGPWRRGVGVASLWYGIGNTSLSNPSAIRLGLRPNGRVMLYNGAVDIGQGSATVLAQIVADALGVPLSVIDQIHGDTDRTEDAGKTSASRQTFVSGTAAARAGAALRRDILRFANAGAAARLRLEPGAVRVIEDDQEHRIDLSALPANAWGDVWEATGRFDPPTTPLDADGQGEPYAAYAFGAQMAEVEVDTGLGLVRVRRMVAAHDVGRAVNPSQVEGQILGGIAQGIGLALMEQYVPGRTDNLHDYLIPTAGDMPEIEIVLIEDPDPLGPFGAKGVGEPALVATAPAILGAVHHATGVRLTRVPATPDRVLAALKADTEQRHGA